MAQKNNAKFFEGYAKAGATCSALRWQSFFFYSLGFFLLKSSHASKKCPLRFLLLEELRSRRVALNLDDPSNIVGILYFVV